MRDILRERLKWKPTWRSQMKKRFIDTDEALRVMAVATTAWADCWNEKRDP